MERRKRRTFTREYKAEVVRLARTSGKTIRSGRRRARPGRDSGSRVGAAGGYRREKGSQPRVRQHGQNEQGLALGRKNYLFVGDEYSGKNVAGLCSLTATCEANTVDPLAYLTDVLGRIGSHPAAKIDELLPQNWKPAAPAPTL